MSTIEHPIENGLVVMCDSCDSPISKYYYTHECGVWRTQLNKKIWCWNCLDSVRKRCRWCGEKYNKVCVPRYNPID